MAPDEPWRHDGNHDVTMRVASGMPVGDNTYQMRADAEANLAALIESTEDLIWSVDLNYRLLTFNRALHDNIQRNFGVRAAVGMRPEDLLPPARAALWPPLYDRALSEGPFRAEYPLARWPDLGTGFQPNRPGW